MTVLLFKPVSHEIWVQTYPLEKPLNNRSLFAHTRRAVVCLLALAALFGGHETAEAATPLSSDATLSSLSMSPGTFNQDFAPGTIAYFATVENAVSQITVTAETNNGSATIEYLDGDNNELTDADEITDDFQVTLVVGITQVRVKVTAPDEMTTKTYVIIITRAAATSVTDATLSRLSLSAGSSLSLTPVFSSSTTIYTATVGNTVSQIVVHGTRNNTSASVAYLDGSDNTLTDADEYTNGFQVNLVVGPNTIKVKMTEEDGTTRKTYTVTVTRVATSVTDATLSGLSLSAGTLAPVFASGTTIYMAAVRNAVSQMTVTATITVTASDPYGETATHQKRQMLESA